MDRVGERYSLEDRLLEDLVVVVLDFKQGVAMVAASPMEEQVVPIRAHNHY